jgi:hypothetical protein
MNEHKGNGLLTKPRRDDWLEPGIIVGPFGPLGPLGPFLLADRRAKIIARTCCWLARHPADLAPQCVRSLVRGLSARPARTRISGIKGAFDDFSLAQLDIAGVELLAVETDGYGVRGCRESIKPEHAVVGGGQDLRNVVPLAPTHGDLALGYQLAVIVFDVPREDAFRVHG